MRWLAASVLCVGSLLVASRMVAATVPPEGDPSGSVPETTGPDSGIPVETAPGGVAIESGAEVPLPAALPSAALVPIPSGCQSPPIASVVFVGTVIAKVTAIARFRVESIRAGEASTYMYGDLVDINYDNETQYLDVDERYLVGAVPIGTSLALSSKVREGTPRFGGNAVIGLTEKNTECPALEDPVRTLHVDGTEIETAMLSALTADKRAIALAFVKPLAVAFAVVLVLVLIRWLFTMIIVAFRHAADSEPRRRVGRDRRHGI